MAGELRREAVPHRVGLRVAVDEQQRRPATALERDPAPPVRMRCCRKASPNMVRIPRCSTSTVAQGPAGVDHRLGPPAACGSAEPARSGHGPCCAGRRRSNADRRVRQGAARGWRADARASRRTTRTSAVVRAPAPRYRLAEQQALAGRSTKSRESPCWVTHTSPLKPLISRPRGILQDEAAMVGEPHVFRMRLLHSSSGPPKVRSRRSVNSVRRDCSIDRQSVPGTNGKLASQA